MIAGIGYCIFMCPNRKPFAYSKKGYLKSNFRLIWTDAATVVRAIREEKESAERRARCAKR